MTNPIAYQSHPLDARQKLARFVFWIGGIFSGFGWIVALVAIALNAQYRDRYPTLDILLFTAGVLITPLLGMLLLYCAALIRRGRRSGSFAAASILVVVAILCALVAVGALMEALDSFIRGSLIDATITFGGGVGGCGAIGLLCLWLAARLYRTA